MTPDEILKAFDNIRVWQHGDRRAPHITDPIPKPCILPDKAAYWPK